MSEISLFLISVFCLGIAIACFISLLLSCLVKKADVKKSLSKFRLVFGSIFISIAIALFTIALIFNNLVTYLESLTTFDYFFYLIFFLVVVISFVSLRYVLPSVIILYILYTTIFLVFLLNVFGNQKQEGILIVQENSITYNGYEFQSESSIDAERGYLVFKTLFLPEQMLLPVSKIWLKPVAVSSERDFDLVGYEEKTEKGFIKQKLLGLISFFISKGTKGEDAFYQTLYIKIPDSEFYPVEYRLILKNTNNNISYDISKIL